MAELVDAIVSGAIRESLYKFKSCYSHFKKEQRVAQLVARRFWEPKVTGSNPVSLKKGYLVGNL